jgi:hypothetical protein
MDPAETRFIQKALIKERGSEDFSKNPHVSHPVRALSYSAISSAVGYLEIDSQRGNEIHFEKLEQVEPVSNDMKLLKGSDQ